MLQDIVLKLAEPKQSGINWASPIGRKLSGILSNLATFQFFNLSGNTQLGEGTIHSYVTSPVFFANREKRAIWHLDCLPQVI